MKTILIIITIISISLLFKNTDEVEVPKDFTVENKLIEIKKNFKDNEIVLCEKNNYTVCIWERKDQHNVYNDSNVCLSKLKECSKKIRSIYLNELLEVYDIDRATSYLTQRDAWLNFLKTHDLKELELNDSNYIKKHAELLNF